MKGTIERYDVAARLSSTASKHKDLFYGTFWVAFTSWALEGSIPVLGVDDTMMPGRILPRGSILSLKSTKLSLLHRLKKNSEIGVRRVDFHGYLSKIFDCSLRKVGYMHASMPPFFDDSLLMINPSRTLKSIYYIIICAVQGPVVSAFSIQEESRLFHDAEYLYVFPLRDATGRNGGAFYVLDGCCRCCHF